jgi:lysyl-tRNA synthetase class 1
MTDTDLQTAAQTSKAWPFEEARKLLKRYPQGKAKDGQDMPVLFETGYGPSGLPHIGTFRRCCARLWCAAPMRC